MAFWNDQGKDPKRNFRFKVIMTGEKFPEGTIWWAKKVGKPNFTVAESKHSFLNHTYYWPGRVEWQAITMTLVDPVDIDAGNDGTVKHLNEIFEASGYKPPANSGDGQWVTQSKKSASVTLGDVKIIQIDAQDNSLEEWTLKGAFIKKITYGELDYENDDLTQMEIELRYDYATCKVIGVDQKAFDSNNPAPAPVQ